MSGGMTVEEAIAAGMDPEVAKEADRKGKAREKYISPRGKLNLPELLDQRRIEYGIIDQLFTSQPPFDRVFVYQLPPDDMKETIGDTNIILTEVGKKREKEQANRGVLIAAGLIAMDYLFSHGIQLGHVVQFIKHAPFRQQVGYVAGEWHESIILQSGDLIGCDDLRQELRDGVMRIEFDEELDQHIYVRNDGTRYVPKQMTLPADY